MSVTIISHKNEVQKNLYNKLKSGMNRAVLIVERQAKTNVTKTGSEHPQRQTGRLVGSITSKVTETKDEIVGEIGTNVEYGKYLELGTVNMPAYPWLFPAVEEKRNDIKDALLGKGFNIE